MSSFFFWGSSLILTFRWCGLINSFYFYLLMRWSLVSILFYLSFISLFLILVLTLVSYSICEICSLNREENSTYECGFEHHSLSRTPFSLRYFFLTLVFLLFDLEVLFLIFMPFSFFSSSFIVFLFISCLVLIILIVGLLFEWYDGSLEWLN